MKKGFIMSEALIGFFIFSMMLVIYLPGLYQMFGKMKEESKKTQYWQIFYEQIKIETNGLNDNPTEYYKDVVDYNCQNTGCWMKFIDGTYLEIFTQK